MPKTSFTDVFDNTCDINDFRTHIFCTQRTQELHKKHNEAGPPQQLQTTSSSSPVSTISRGVIFTRARVSLALLSLRKNGDYSQSRTATDWCWDRDKSFTKTLDTMKVACANEQRNTLGPEDIFFLSILMVRGKAGFLRTDLWSLGNNARAFSKI